MWRVNMDTLESMGETIDTKTEQDEYPSNIRQVTVLEEKGAHTIVITDIRNKCVKSFHTKNNKTSQSRLQLNSLPDDIDALGDNKVLVVVPDARQVVTLEVTPDLVYVAHFKTSKTYHSLACMGATKVAAGTLGSVDILNMQGEVLQSMALRRDKAMFSSPWYMCTNSKGHLLVSDWKLATATCVTSEEKVRWKYHDKSGGKFGGITTTVGGDTLVADLYRHKVIQLSESGKYVRDVITEDNGLRYMNGICSDNHGSLFVCDTGALKKFAYQ